MPVRAKNASKQTPEAAFTATEPAGAALPRSPGFLLGLVQCVFNSVGI
jgi:hypothetical protein